MKILKSSLMSMKLTSAMVIVLVCSCINTYAQTDAELMQRQNSNKPLSIEEKKAIANAELIRRLMGKTYKLQNSDHLPMQDEILLKAGPRSSSFEFNFIVPDVKVHSVLVYDQQYFNLPGLLQALDSNPKLAPYATFISDFVNFTEIREHPDGGFGFYRDDQALFTFVPVVASE